MEKTMLYKATEVGQEIWHDDLYRTLITSGGLAEMIEIDGLSGVTSNPTIFDGAINSDNAYDDDLLILAKENRNAEEIYADLTIKDIQMACDVLKPVFDKSDSEKGYVSLEVNPHLAYDSKKTYEDVRQLFSMVNRENLMIKVPGTSEGIEAIQRLITGGFNINVTLLFSVEQYERVAWAYIKGLEERAEQGLDISQVRSVASFFLSRIDKVIDPEIDMIAQSEVEPSKSQEIRELRGKAAIAVAKLTYGRFEKIFNSQEFIDLKEKGARIQKPLWASMSTKDPAYSDVKYVEALIFPKTVCTMPMVTAEAFRDHGQVFPASVEAADESRTLIDMEALGIDVNGYLNKLQKEGVQAFIDSYEHLLETINNKKSVLLTKASGS